MNKMNKNKKIKNNKNVKRGARKNRRGGNNVMSVNSNPFFPATLIWSFIVDSTSEETSFGLKISDVFLYLREQFEIDQTMKLWFKISNASFTDYCYRGHLSQVFNYPTGPSATDVKLGPSGTRQFWPQDFSKPSSIKISWNKSTRNHTFTEDEEDNYLSIIRLSKPISETIKSTQCVFKLFIRWRTINDDPLREIPTQEHQSLNQIAKCVAQLKPVSVNKMIKKSVI